VGRAPPDRPRRRRRRAENFALMIFNHQDAKATRLGNHFAPGSPELDRLANKRLGLLINFNVPKIKDGIKRIVL
jgi:hypothetical protein